VYRVLERKLLRDLRRTRAQALAIALVVACAVATVVMAANVRRTLDESLASYYATYEFADIFATAAWAPESLVPAIRNLPGVRAVETRIAAWAVFFPSASMEPAVGRVLSLPDGRSATVNRIALRAGGGGEVREATTKITS
jgi:putative ABC transport system permease protein